MQTKAFYIGISKDILEEDLFIHDHCNAQDNKAIQILIQRRDDMDT